MSTPLPASPPRPLPRHGTWRTYTPADGLAEWQTEHLAEDAAGQLWIATPTRGLCRYDGHAFRTFTTRDGLPGNQVYTVLLDRRERLWVGTWDGLGWYEGERFHRFPAGAPGVHQPVIALFEDGAGRLWFGGYETLGYWDGERVHDRLPQVRQRYAQPFTTCWGISEDREGGIWVGFWGSLLRYDGQGFYRFGPGEGLAEPAVVSAGYPTGVDGSGRVWVGDTHRLWCYEDGRFRSVGELGGTVRKIQSDREGRLWFSTIEAGVRWLEGDTVQAFTRQDGLAYDTVNGMVQDGEGQFWFATWGGGVSCYNAYRVQWYGMGEGLPFPEVYTLLEDRQGRLWLGFSGLMPRSAQPPSLGYYVGSCFTVVDGVSGSWTGSCRALCQDRQGRVWVAAARGLFCYAGETLRRVFPPEGEAEFEVHAVRAARSGGLLVGHADPGETATYLSWYDGQRFATVLTLPRTRHASYLYVAQVREGEGGWWLALSGLGGQGEGGGLGWWAGAGEVTWYTTTEGLPDNRVEDVLVDRQGQVWLATLGGLGCFDGRRFTTYTVAEGLPSEGVRCVYEDRQGRLWIGTEAGLVRYDGRRFQTVGGLALGPVRRILQDAQDRYWLATPQGVVGYTPQTTPPRLRITQVIAGQLYPAGEGEGQVVEVPTTTRQVLVEYHGVSWQQPSQPLLYETWLQGYEADWQKATRGLRVGYTDLPVGEYTFQVRALDGELNTSDPASLHLSIVPDPRLEAWQAAVRQSAPRGEFVGQSAAVQRVLAQLVQAGQTEVTVLLLGETGTGKGLAARTLHEHSGRRDGPLVQVSCGALPEGLVESELFGHERGSFTGAHARQLGKVELAEGGTLFLDEIGDLPLALQGKLLRLLEEHTFERVGGTQTWRATARVVAATNRDLEQMVREQTFRADLYYRLNPFLVRLPPLRERREDLPALVDHFLGPMALHLHKGVRGITAEALEVLKGWSWPGNVRELKNVVERAVIGCKGPLLQVADLGLEREGGTAAERVVEGSEGAWVTLEEHERRYLRQVLAKTGGVIRGANGAAAILGIPESSLRWRLKKLGIEKP